MMLADDFYGQFPQAGLLKNVHGACETAFRHLSVSQRKILMPFSYQESKSESMRVDYVTNHCLCYLKQQDILVISKDYDVNVTFFS